MKPVLVLILSMLLMAGSQTQANSPNLPDHPSLQSAVQPQTTLDQRLNARYTSTVAACSGNTPAYKCSGILFRRATYSPNYDFWGQSDDAIRLGSTTFSYIRRGVKSNSSDVTDGYIMMDPASASAAGKIAVKARCIYPFMADTQANNRAMNGCGFANGSNPVPPPADLSTCATLSSPAITPAAWIANFTSHGPSRINQCSLSTEVAAQFITSLTVRASFPDLSRTYGNEILFENWSTANPAQLPIEAIFYDAARGSLQNAQALKRAYQAKTNIALPIVRIDLTNRAHRFMVEPDLEDDAAVAQRLNARYTSKIAACSGNTPAYKCSGILFRRATYSPNYDFWGQSDDAIRLGSTTFSYIRRGVKSNSSDVTDGYIMMDPASASAAGKIAVKARCIYPFMADTQANNRAMNGCGFANGSNPVPPPADLSTCATLSSPAITPAAWIANFTSHGPSRINQCSLSTEVAAQFITSLTVRASFPDLSRTYGNEILFENWSTANPAQLPIEAIFYDAARGSLQNAQALKRAYQAKTNIALPIVRIDLTNRAHRFMVEPDLEDGAAVAQRLNARHADTASSCAGGEAPVYCNGVLVRATSYSTRYHAWNPNPNAQPIGATSLSYLRGDIKTLALFNSKAQGVIFRELNSVPSGRTAMQALCIYMADADTWDRVDKGCGVNSKSPTPGSGSCASQGITTLEQLRPHWLAAPASPEWQRLHHQCSLAISPVPFMLAINGRRQNITGTESPYYRYNEIMIANWTMNAPQYVDAIYYVMGNAEGLRQAKEIQEDIKRSANGLIKPVIRMNLDAAPDAVFSYLDSDQSF